MCTANTCFETTVPRTVKDDVVQFTDIRKVKYLFKHVGIYETLTKQISNQGSAKVIVSKIKPFLRWPIRLIHKHKSKTQ